MHTENERETEIKRARNRDIIIGGKKETESHEVSKKIERERDEGKSERVKVERYTRKVERCTSS